MLGFYKVQPIKIYFLIWNYLAYQLSLSVTYKTFVLGAVKGNDENQWKIPALLPFLQKGQLCQLKNSRKTKFLHLFSVEQNAKLLPFLSMLVV